MKSILVSSTSPLLLNTQILPYSNHYTNTVAILLMNIYLTDEFKYRKLFFGLHLDASTKF